MQPNYDNTNENKDTDEIVSGNQPDQPNQLAALAILARYTNFLCKRDKQLFESRKIFRHGKATGRDRKTVSVKVKA